MNKINVLIVEDEELFADNFGQILREIDPYIEVKATLESVSSSIKWLKENTVDLIFLDIQLSDGLSFEIFNHVNVDIPVIFITSFDQYAIKAFKLNSIDYLLKPLNIEDLKQALEKFRKYAIKPINPPDYNQFFKMMMNTLTENKKRFLVYVGEKIKYIETENIAYFFILERDVYLRDIEGGTYPVEFSLDKLETMLDADKYFRINRRYIINIRAIKNMFTLSKSSIKIELIPRTDEETIVSLSRSVEFKRWLNR